MVAPMSEILVVLGICSIGIVLGCIYLWMCCNPRAESLEGGEGDVNPHGNTTLEISILPVAQPNLSEANATRSETTFFEGMMKCNVEDLLTASAELLGIGTFGTSYKVSLGMGGVFVVKIFKNVDVSEIEFKERAEIVGAMRQPNIVSLRAYYFNNDNKILLYDYMPKGSLSALIHGSRESDRTPLEWRRRLHIAYDTACGISYIHSTAPTMSHGNIKSANILFDESKGAHVSEQCVAQLVQPETSKQDTSYLAPEVIDQREFSQKADVYSFGVVLLELVTAKAPNQMLEDKGMNLTRWVESIEHKEWPVEVFDLELLDYPDEYQEIMKLLDLAMECVSQYPEKRPTMPEIVYRIERMQ